MKFLELFSGSATVSAEAQKRGYDIRTLDICPKNNPIYCIDICEWDYKEALKDWRPDIIWASPDCRSWSIACHKHRTLKDGLKPKTDIAIKGEEMIHKTLEIIKWCKPKVYIIENPRGRLRHFPPMLDIPFHTTVYYSNYGHPIHKPTDLWSNKKLHLLTSKPHIDTIRWRNWVKDPLKRATIPQKLIDHILDQI